MTPLNEIEGLLDDYFDALYDCDTEKLKSVFHPRALYATADETPPLFRTMEEYLHVIETREAPASRQEARRDVIHSIELAGANTAMARVGCRIGERQFTDFLSLIRTQGRWQIIAKVFEIIEPQTEE